MSRWIDADALKIPSEEMVARMIINSTPSIDIVRCGECRHWNSETKGCNRNPSVEAWRADDFCSYGEMRETNTDCQWK